MHGCIIRDASNPFDDDRIFHEYQFNLIKVGHSLSGNAIHL